MAGLVLALLFTLGWIPLLLFRTEVPRDAWPDYDGDERVWIRLTPAILVAHVTAACAAVSLRTSVPIWRAALGMLIFSAGVGFWLWARSMIGPLRERRLPHEPPLKFQRSGAFGLVRNPLYLGILIAAAAPVVVAMRSFFLVTYVACVIALAVRSAQDERRLHAQLGPPYAAYCGQVKRLIPFVY